MSTGNTSIVVLAHNIRSLWNVGSFFRTCDAFGVQHLYLTGYTGLPPREEISKTAIGAEEWIPWTYEHDPHVIIERLRKEGFAIIALELAKDSMPIDQFQPKKRICLIVGHEVSGVPDELLDAADQTIHIPMQGKKESLNVSVALGIALHALQKNG